MTLAVGFVAPRHGLVHRSGHGRRVVEQGIFRPATVICGALKIVYDVALLFTFRHIKPPEER